MEKKSHKGLIIILILIILMLLGGFGYLYFTDKISFNLEEEKEVKEDNSVEENKQEIINSEEKYFYDISELKIKNTGVYKVFDDISNNTNSVEEINVYNGKYYAYLYLNGDVGVKAYINEEWKKGTLDIHNVIDIIGFDIPGDETEQLLYMLTKDGSVYKFKFGNIDNDKYSVTKVDDVSKVKKIFISQFSKPNAGGSWALFAITEDNDCIMIEAASV